MDVIEFGPIQLFGTAYDPSDLPGTSVDPMGFEAGYVTLAEALLPGLTTITDAPRYPGMLCAGLKLMQGAGDEGSRVAIEDRCLGGLFRLERLWAVASVLRWRDEPDARDDALGTLRGITYATAQADRIDDGGLSELTPAFPFLRRQRINGAVGVYRNFLEKCGLVFENEWRLTPDLGEPLGEAVIRETQMPASVKAAVRDGTLVSVSALRAWGRYAHPTQRLGDEEKRVLREAVLGKLQRRATLGLLRQARQGWLQAADGELAALDDMLGHAQAGRQLRGVPSEVLAATAASLSVIPAYEGAYRAILLGFERILWLVRQSPGGTTADALLRDTVIEQLPKRLKQTGQRLVAVLEAARNLPVEVREGLAEPLSFIGDLAERSSEPKAAVGAILLRHKEVQQGKLDRGQRKAPWVVEAGERYSLTFARVGGLHRPAERATDIAAHNYRLRNARRFMAALEIGA